MRSFSSHALLASAVALTFSTTASAGVFTENVVVDEADVIAGSSVLAAVNLGAAQGNPTVNGVTFTDAASPLGGNLSNFGGPPVTGDYANLLTSNEDGFSTTTISIGGIEAGTEYNFQIWSQSGNATPRSLSLAVGGSAAAESYFWLVGPDGSTNTGGINGITGASGTEGSPGVDSLFEYVTYNFTATSSDDFEFTVSDLFFSNVEAYSLTSVAVPEPASLALLGLGGVALVGRRRKA